MSCAGWDELRPFLDTDEAFRAKVLEINLAGPVRVTRAVLPAMVERPFGRIVNIGSDAAGFVTGQTLSVSGGLTMA